MKKFALFFLGVCALLFLVLFGSWHFLASDYIGQKIVSECENKLGYSPQFQKEPELTLLPLTIKFDQLQWQGQTTEWKFTFSARSLSVEMKIMPLLTGQIEIAEIFLDRPNFVLEARAGSTSSQSSPPLSGKIIPIDRIITQDGSFSWHDGYADIRLEDLKVSAENFQDKKETDLRCDFTIHAQEKNTKDKINGNLAIKSKIHYYYPNLTFRQTSASYTHLEGNPLFFPLQLAMEGALNLENLEARFTLAQISMPGGQIKLNGNGTISPLNFKGEASINLETGMLAAVKAFGLPEKLLISSPFTLAPDRIKLPALAINLDNIQGSGYLDLEFPKDDKPLSVTGKISAGNLTLAQHVQTDASSQQDSRQISNINQTSNYPDVNLILELAGLNYRKLALRKIALNLTGSKGEYRIAPFSFDFAGGQIKGEAQGSLPASTCQLNISGEKIDFGDALREVGLGGFEKGILSLNGNLSARGSTPDQILSSITGKGMLTVQDSRVTLLEDVGVALAFIGKKSTDYSGVSIQAPFSITAGKMDIIPIALQSSVLTARGQAFINLPQSSLDSRINFRLGVLDIPLTFKGNLGNIAIGMASDAAPQRSKNGI